MTDGSYRKCRLCPEYHQYKYCSRCPDKYNANEKWRNAFCSEKCRDIYKAIEAYANKSISAQEAKRILQNCEPIPRKMIHRPTRLVLEDIESKV